MDVPPFSMAYGQRKWEPLENPVAGQEVQMPRSAGMRESGVRVAMSKQKPWMAFF